jgi:hypothetical protein
LVGPIVGYNQIVPKTLSDVELARIESMFSKLLRRELTREERKYLGLSCVACPPNKNPKRDKSDDKDAA